MLHVIFQQFSFTEFPAQIFSEKQGRLWNIPFLILI